MRLRQIMTVHRTASLMQHWSNKCKTTKHLWIPMWHILVKAVAMEETTLGQMTLCHFTGEKIINNKTCSKSARSFADNICSIAIHVDYNNCLVAAKLNSCRVCVNETFPIGISAWRQLECGLSMHQWTESLIATTWAHTKKTVIIIIIPTLYMLRYAYSQYRSIYWQCVECCIW